MLYFQFHLSEYALFSHRRWNYVYHKVTSKKLPISYKDDICSTFTFIFLDHQWRIRNSRLLDSAISFPAGIKFFCIEITPFKVDQHFQTLGYLCIAVKDRSNLIKSCSFVNEGMHLNCLQDVRNKQWGYSSETHILAKFQCLWKTSVKDSLCFKIKVLSLGHLGDVSAGISCTVVLNFIQYGVSFITHSLQTFHSID